MNKEKDLQPNAWVYMTVPSHTHNSVWSSLDVFPADPFWVMTMAVSGWADRAHGDEIEIRMMALDKGERSKVPYSANVFVSYLSSDFSSKTSGLMELLLLH